MKQIRNTEPIVHALKNHLTVIKGFNSLLKKKLSALEDEEVNEYITKIDERTNKMVNYINEKL